MVNKQQSQKDIEQERMEGAINILLKRHNNLPCLKWECRNGNCLACIWKASDRGCQFFSCLGCKYVSECVGEITKVQ
jgi:hypothetical protein